MNKKIIPTLGVSSCIGGSTNSCAEGPAVLQSSQYSLLLNNIELEWDPLIIVSSEFSNSLDMFYKQSCVISQFSQTQFENEKAFLVLGGDHSIALGTWSGILKQLPAESTFALIWIDAHMNAHTLETSPCGNLHSMPVSILLGEADHKLQACSPTDRTIDGQDIYFFGVRSYEAEELVLLSKKKANVFDIDRIEKDGGVRKVLKKLVGTIDRCYDYYAISLDLDGIDPKDAPGVGVRAESGLNADDLLTVFKELTLSKKFIGLEIAEFDPKNDIEKKTEKLVYQIISAIYK